MRLLLAVLIAVITLSVFSHVLDCGFVDFDDLSFVVNNPVVRAGLTTDGVAWASTYTRSGYWMPLTWLSHMLDAQLYDMAPAGHHLTSLLLHAGNVALLFQRGYPVSDSTLSKIYAESFVGREHLARVLEEARALVAAVLAR